MSNDATVKFGYDGAELNRGLADAERRITTSSRTIERNMARTATRSSGAMRNLGGASMQVQDIAVQLQMGTRLSTVVAQQGSQMLSAFGPAGAIAGGLVAIGGAFVMMGQNAKKAFDDSKLAAQEFDAEFKKVMISGDASLMSSQLEKVQLNLQGATKDLQDLQGTFSLGANISDIFGGPSVEERINAAGEAMSRSAEQYGKLVTRTLEVSEREVEIASLRSEGREQEAAQMERSAALAREIARIESQKIPMYAKEQLIIDARAKSALLMRQTADAERLTLDRKAAERQGNRDTEMRSLRALDLRSRGREREAQRIERAAKIESEIQRIRSTTGASPEQARDIAERRVALEENIQRRNSGQRSRITAPRGDGGPFGQGFDEFLRAQQKREVGFNEAPMAGYARGQAVPVFSRYLVTGDRSLSQHTRALTGGGIDAFLTKQRLPMSTSATAVGNTTAAQKSNADIGPKIDRTNELLNRVFFAN